MGIKNNCSFNFLYYLSIGTSTIDKVKINSDFLSNYCFSTFMVLKITASTITVTDYSFTQLSTYNAIFSRSTNGMLYKAYNSIIKISKVYYTYGTINDGNYSIECSTLIFWIINGTGFTGQSQFSSIQITADIDFKNKAGITNEYQFAIITY